MNYYIVFILVLLIDKKKGSTILVCEYGYNGKCLHDLRNAFVNGYPKSDAGFLSILLNTTFNFCIDVCNKNAKCGMVSFNISDNNCNLYKRISYEDTGMFKIKLYLYICCDTNNSFDPQNRCPGFWKHKPQSLSDNDIRSNDPLIEYKGLNEYQCQMKCLSNPICGAANVDTSNNCQLIIQFPVEMLVFVANNDWETFQWTCSFDNYKPTPSKECQHRVDHDDGYWSIENTSIRITNNTKYLINFYTMDYKQCLNNCALYPHCKMAWYSLNRYYCVLEGSTMSTCAQESSENFYVFTTYIWQSCPKQAFENVIIETKDFPCRTLVDNNFTYIYPINCGHLEDHISKPYPCWNKTAAARGTIFSHTLHCQIKQSFSVLDSNAPVINNFSNVTWMRVYTGYEDFWLVNVSDINFPEASKKQCQIFDSNMDVSNFPPPKILKRTEWFAPKPRGKENRFPDHAVKYVIITDTEQPYCNCFSIEACSSIMRIIQMSLNFYSIPYSFVITGDGVVYEGRGWDFEPQVAQAHYNPNSLAIALCGRYHKNPDVIPLISVKQLIKMAIDKGKVSKEYILYIYNDVMDRPYPYNGLRRVFELWPHYRGHIRKDCNLISNLTIVLNTVFTSLLFIIMFSFGHYFIRKWWHSENCNLVRKCRIETIYCNRFNKSSELLPHILVHNLNELLDEFMCISPFTSPFYWIEDRRILSEKIEQNDSCPCKSAIFSIFDLYQSQSKLVNLSTILLLPEITNCLKTLAVVFQRNTEVRIDGLLFLHFRREQSFVKFIYRLHQSECLCDCFNITKYHFKYFVTELCYIEPNKRSESKRSNCRDDLQQKYSYKNDSKITVFYPLS